VKSVDKFYDKIYKETSKITKKLFGEDVTGSLSLRYQLKKEIESLIKRPISEITNDDVIKYHLGYKYAKYKTLSKILEIIESACVLKTFTIEEFEK